MSALHPALDPDQAARLMAAVAEHQDRDAFAALYRNFAPRIRGWLMARGAPATQAEEVLHEVMLAVWRRADRYDPARAAVSTWLFTIARNRHIDRVRRLSRPEPDPDDPQFVPSAPVPADHALAQLQTSTRLHQAIDLLPEAQAQVIRRTWLEGATLRQLSIDLEVPLGTIKSRSRLAFVALRRSLLAPRAS